MPITITETIKSLILWRSMQYAHRIIQWLISFPVMQHHTNRVIVLIPEAYNYRTTSI